MNAPQPSYRPPTHPSACDSCQYCPRCDPTPEYPRDRFRFCVDHGLGRKFVELRDCAASGHECDPTAPLRRSARPGQQLSNPRTAQIGQIPSPQPQHPQGYDTEPAYTYGNNPGGQHRRGGVLYERMTAVGKAKAHWGSNYHETPRSEGMQVWRDIRLGDETDIHCGNNYGKNPETGGQAKHPDAFDRMERDDFCNPP